jgi:hypothetical protein
MVMFYYTYYTCSSTSVLQAACAGAAQRRVPGTAWHWLGLLLTACGFMAG